MNAAPQQPLITLERITTVSRRYNLAARDMPLPPLVPWKFAEILTIFAVFAHLLFAFIGFAYEYHYIASALLFLTLFFIPNKWFGYILETFRRSGLRIASAQLQDFDNNVILPASIRAIRGFFGHEVVDWRLLSGEVDDLSHYFFEINTAALSRAVSVLNDLLAVSMYLFISAAGVLYLFEATFAVPIAFLCFYASRVAIMLALEHLEVRLGLVREFYARLALRAAPPPVVPPVAAPAPVAVPFVDMMWMAESRSISRHF